LPEFPDRALPELPEFPELEPPELPEFPELELPELPEPELPEGLYRRLGQTDRAAETSAEIAALLFVSVLSCATDLCASNQLRKQLHTCA